MSWLLRIFSGLIIICIYVQAQDLDTYNWDNLESCKGHVFLAYIDLDPRILIDCQIPYPASASEPYDIKIKYRGFSGPFQPEPYYPEFVEIGVIAIGEITKRSTWKSRWLYIEFKPDRLRKEEGEFKFRISTANCRKAILIKNDSDRLSFILSHFDQSKYTTKYTRQKE